MSITFSVRNVVRTQHQLDGLVGRSTTGSMRVSPASWGPGNRNLRGFAAARPAAGCVTPGTKEHKLTQ